jgi:methyl-accepting chemotaxis protein
LIRDGKVKVDSTTAVAMKCAHVLDDLVEKASSVSVMSQAITVASQEQAKGAQEINKAMNKLNAVTQNNALAAKHTAGAAEELAGESVSLERAIRHLVATVEGAARDHNSVDESRDVHDNEESGTEGAGEASRAA